MVFFYNFSPNNDPSAIPDPGLAGPYVNQFFNNTNGAVAANTDNALVKATSAIRTFTLPPHAQRIGKRTLYLKNSAQSTFGATFDPGASLIDGQAGVLGLNNAGASVGLVATSEGWIIVSSRLF